MLVYYQPSRTPIQYLSAGNEWLKTRRMGKPNRRAYRPKAPRFSPYRNGTITPTDLLVHSLSPRLLKLTRMGKLPDRY